MIRLPWVSRGRYEDMRERAEAAEARIDDLQDQLTRLTRVRNGRPEIPPDQKDTEPDTLPEEILRHISGYDSAAVQDQLKREAWQARREGQSWSAIKANLGVEREAV